MPTEQDEGQFVEPDCWLTELYARIVRTVQLEVRIAALEPVRPEPTRYTQLAATYTTEADSIRARSVSAIAAVPSSACFLSDNAGREWRRFREAALRRRRSQTSATTYFSYDSYADIDAGRADLEWMYCQEAVGAGRKARDWNIEPLDLTPLSSYAWWWPSLQIAPGMVLLALARVEQPRVASVVLSSGSDAVLPIELYRPVSGLLPLAPPVEAAPRVPSVITLDQSDEVRRDQLRLVDGIRAAFRSALTLPQAAFAGRPDTHRILLILLVACCHYGHGGAPDGYSLRVRVPISVVRGELVLAC